MLLKGSPADFSQPFDELVIVPDGVLWYLPFEALQVKVDGQSQPLIVAVPHPLRAHALAVPPRRARAATRRATRPWWWASSIPATTTPWPRRPSSSLPRSCPARWRCGRRCRPPRRVYSTLFHRLIVLDDLVAPSDDPYGWAPVPMDRGKAGGTLSDWLLLPWGGPDVIILPGFHTAAEDALKRAPPRSARQRVFLSVCGLMASGARTVLLSRWRTGGQTSFDLVREFAQELPHTTPADAWQRAVLLAVDSRLNLEAEPRHQARGQRRTAQGSQSVFLGRLHARRLRQRGGESGRETQRSPPQGPPNRCRNPNDRRQNPESGPSNRRIASPSGLRRRAFESHK